MEKLLFSFTPPITRYLEEINNKFDKMSQGSIENQKITPFFIDIETYKQDEPFMTHYEDNRGIFLNYLENRKAIRLSAVPENVWGHTVKLFDDHIEQTNFYKNIDDFVEINGKKIPIKFRLEIFDINVIKKLLANQRQRPKTPTLKEIQYYENVQVTYDDITRRLIYQSSNKKFNWKTNPTRAKIFDILWKNHSHMYNNKEMWSPVLLDLSELAKTLKISDTSLKKKLKSIKNELTSKGFPLNINYSNNTVLMKINEKV